MKSWWHQNVRGDKGRNVGIINTEGEAWSHQRRFALKELRDLGFGKKSLDSIMNEEVDEVIEKISKEKTAVMDGTFNTPIINVLWQIVASKRFEHNAPDTERMMSNLKMQFKDGFNLVKYLSWFRPLLPMNEIDKSIIEMKDMMRELIHEHLADIDYDNPRDFIDTYLTQIQKEGNYFDIENLVVVCLDFFQAGAETTRYLY